MALGVRTLTGLAAALVSASLIFAAPEVGIAGVASGVGVGIISAVLMRPHLHSVAKSSSSVQP